MTQSWVKLKCCLITNPLNHSADKTHLQRILSQNPGYQQLVITSSSWTSCNYAHWACRPVALHKVTGGVKVNLKESIYRRRTKRAIVSGAQASISEMEQAVNMSQPNARCYVRKLCTFARLVSFVSPYSLLNEQLCDNAFTSGALNQQVQTFAPSTYN